MANYAYQNKNTYDESLGLDYGEIGAPKVCVGDTVFVYYATGRVADEGPATIVKLSDLFDGSVLCKVKYIAKLSREYIEYHSTLFYNTRDVRLATSEAIQEYRKHIHTIGKLKGECMNKLLDQVTRQLLPREYVNNKHQAKVFIGIVCGVHE